MRLSDRDRCSILPRLAIRLSGEWSDWVSDQAQLVIRLSQRSGSSSDQVWKRSLNQRSDRVSDQTANDQAQPAITLSQWSDSASDHHESMKNDREKDKSDRWAGSSDLREPSPLLAGCSGGLCASHAQKVEKLVVEWSWINILEYNEWKTRQSSTGGDGANANTHSCVCWRTVTAFFYKTNSSRIVLKKAINHARHYIQFVRDDGGGKIAIGGVITSRWDRSQNDPKPRFPLQKTPLRNWAGETERRHAVATPRIQDMLLWRW